MHAFFNFAGRGRTFRGVTPGTRSWQSDTWSGCRRTTWFYAGHFITFAGDVCERLHGHNYRVTAEAEGPLDENHYVIDFIAFRDALRVIVDELDHHMLLPTQHPKIHVLAGDREVEVTFEDRRWMFPRCDCILLPVPNTTSELLARYIADRVLADLESRADWPVRRGCGWRSTSVLATSPPVRSANSPGRLEGEEQADHREVGLRVEGCIVEQAARDGAGVDVSLLAEVVLVGQVQDCAAVSLRLYPALKPCSSTPSRKGLSVASGTGLP